MEVKLTRRPSLILLLACALAVPVRAGDEASAADPWHETEHRLLAYARTRRADPRRGHRELEAARAYAATRSPTARSEALTARVDAWAAFAPDALARALRIAEARAGMADAGRRGDWGEVLARLPPLAPDLAAGLDTVGLVGVHREAARAHATLGQVGEALQHARVAAEIAGRLAWHERAAALWHRTARYASTNGEYETARGAARRAVAAYAEAGRDPPPAVLQHDLAIATYRAGHLRDALGLAQEARREALAADDAATAARVLNTLVNVHMALGAAERATEIAHEAIAEAKALGDRDGWLKTTVNLAAAHARCGRFPDAIAACETVLASPEAERDVRLHVSAAGNLAGILLRLGKVDEAIRRLTRATERARAAGLDALAVDLEGGIATALVETERVADTPEVLARIGAYYDRTGNRQGGARVRSSLAAAYARIGRREDAERVLAEALATFEALGDRIGAARAHAASATAHEGRRRWQEAWRGHRSALRTYRELGLRVEGTALALLGCARIHVKAGSPESALPLLDEATAIYVDLCQGLGDEDALGLAARAREVGDWGIAVAHHVARHPDRGREAATIAHRHFESTRAILLAEALAHSGSVLETSLPPELRAADRASREDVTGARGRLLALAAAGGDPDEIAAARKSLEAAWRARRSCVARIHREARRVAGLAYPTVLPLDAVQRALDDDTVLVSYRLLKYGFALVVSREDAALVRLEESKAIRRLARAYLRVAANPELAEDALARELHACLVAPLADRIGAARHLVVSPDDVLAWLPFAAVLDADTDTRLVERHAISQVPSATRSTRSPGRRCTRGSPRAEPRPPTWPRSLRPSVVSCSRGTRPPWRRCAARSEPRTDASPRCTSRVTRRSTPRTPVDPRSC